jgi:hydrogenase/urease accessory protein HupE
MRRALLASLCLVLAAAGAARAHSFEPALLDLREREGGVFDLVWRAPGAESGALVPGAPPLTPEVPAHCHRLPSADDASEAAAPAFSRIDCGARGLRGEQLSIVGLEGSRVDAIVRIAWRDGTTTTGVLRSGAERFVVPAADRQGALGAGAPVRQVFSSYARLGVEHILFGYDHLAFVLGLILLVQSWRALVRTITAFTLAHSLSLALAVLGVVALPPAPIEALIAASIVLVAVELARAPGERPTLTRRAPWLVAFAFGLLHGLGFAGALAEIGLPPDQVPLALLAFNLGVEAGQLLFVAAVLGAASLVTRAAAGATARGWFARARDAGVSRWQRAIGLVPAYAIGTLASAWMIERIARFWTPSI